MTLACRVDVDLTTKIDFVYEHFNPPTVESLEDSTTNDARALQLIVLFSADYAIILIIPRGSNTYLLD